MKITNFGGATALIEHNGIRLLMDPWLDDGIFHGSWVHYPPLALGVEDVGPLNFIFISHIHEDHCSLGTLKALDHNATVLVMDRRPNFVLNFLTQNQLNFREIKLISPRTPTLLAPDLWVDMVEPDPSDAMASAIDSSVVLKWSGKIIFNANDCQPHPAMIDYVVRTYGRPDLALLPYCGGSGYPSCYANLSDTEKDTERKRIQSMRLAAFVDAVKALQPVRVLPFADQYAIVGSRYKLNRFVSHPPTPAAVQAPLEKAGLEHMLILLNSGQSWDLQLERYDPPEAYRDLSEDDRQMYLQEKSLNVLYDHEKVSLAPTVPIDRLIGYARARLWKMQSSGAGMSNWSIALDVPELKHIFVLRLDTESVACLERGQSLPEPLLKVGASRTLMTMLLLGHISWNIADAALFLDYDRHPNQYDPSVYVLLNMLKV